MRRRRPRRARRRLVAVLGLGVLMLPVGLAHLAQNTVPVTRAGETQQTLDLRSVVEAQPATVRLAPDGGASQRGMRAWVTRGGQPLADAPISFEIAGQVVCTARTGPAGEARCEGLDLPATVARPAAYVARLGATAGVPETWAEGDLVWVEDDAAAGGG